MLQVVTVEGGFTLANYIRTKVGTKAVKHPSRGGRKVNHGVFKNTVEFIGKQVWKTKRGAEAALDKALNPG